MGCFQKCKLILYYYITNILFREAKDLLALLDLQVSQELMALL